jgi:phytoene/squalene synthetase
MPAAPKMDPVRRNSRVGPLRLPAEGRGGAAPSWPLSVPEDDGAGGHAAELQVWSELWATPQAVAWERLGWTRVVARYARLVIAAERLDKDAMSEARQLEDRLGLTPKAMRLLLWEITADEVGEKRDVSASSARGRIKAV